jgi:hypothetical protein
MHMTRPTKVRTKLPLRIQLNIALDSAPSFRSTILQEKYPLNWNQNKPNPPLNWNRYKNPCTPWECSRDSILKISHPGQLAERKRPDCQIIRKLASEKQSIRNFARTSPTTSKRTTRARTLSRSGSNWPLAICVVPRHMLVDIFRVEKWTYIGQNRSGSDSLKMAALLTRGVHCAAGQSWSWSCQCAMNTAPGRPVNVQVSTEAN